MGMQSENSLRARDPETGVLLLRELSIGFVAYSPLGRRFLTGQITSAADCDTNDFRKTNPRFEGDNLVRNLSAVDEVIAIAERVGATPAQVVLARLLAQGDDIVPIPGTITIARPEQNVAAGAVELTQKQTDQPTLVARPPVSTTVSSR